jgi:putative membrane protein
LHEWSPPIFVNAALAASLYFYIVGWVRLRKSAHSPEPSSAVAADRHAFPPPLTVSALAAYCCGIFALWLAIGSPLEALDDASLLAHMTQHLLLMLAAPPLILLGAPMLPILHGLPRVIVRSSGPVGAFLRTRAAQSLGDFLSRPLVCWIFAIVAMIGWHVPAAFEMALRSNAWHEAEHATFLATSLMFWWPVIQPWPSQARISRWAIPLYLLLAMIAGSTVSAYLTFSDRVVYPSYADAPRLFASLTPLDDQILAGALMWVAMTIVLLIPAVAVTIKLLSPARRTNGQTGAQRGVPQTSPSTPKPQFN